VGIGLDAGEAVPVEGGYRGGALNLAARLCGQARAGEILASREVTHLARRLDGVRYEERGLLTLKGLSDPVTVVRVVPETGDPVERLHPFAPPPGEPHRERSRWAIPIGAATIVLALVAISVPLLRSNDPVAVGANSIARLDANNGGVQLAEALGERPGTSAVGLGSLWVVQPDRNVIVRIDLDDGSANDRISVGNSPSGVTIGDGSVWVANAGSSNVSRVSPATGEVSEELQAGSSPTSIAFGGGALWIADSIGSALLRLDPESEDLETVELPGQPSDVTFTPEGVWVSLTPTSVALVDPETLTLTLEQPVGGGHSAILSAFDSI
jgi:streptogramin lyase